MLDGHATGRFEEKFQRFCKFLRRGEVGKNFRLFFCTERAKIRVVLLLDVGLKLRQAGHVFLNILRRAAVVEDGEHEVSRGFRGRYAGFATGQQRFGELVEQRPLLTVERDVFINGSPVLRLAAWQNGRC